MPENKCYKLEIYQFDPRALEIPMQQSLIQTSPAKVNSKVENKVSQP